MPVSPPEVIAMLARRPLALMTDLQRLNQQLVDLACPGCGGSTPYPIWSHDRYFLKVRLSACQRCGLVYLARGLSGQVQDDFYSRLYPRLMRQPPSALQLWQYRLLAGYRYSEISAVTGAVHSVLDVGAGLGFFLDACRAQGCSQYLGLEPGGPQREHAVQVLGLGDNVRAQGLSDDTRLPFAPHLVTLFHVLEHLEDPGRALRQIARLMDPQGWLVIEVPDIRADWRELGLHQVHISHRSYFCAQTLEVLLRNSGFSVAHLVHEAHGIYNGNLRVYARPGAEPVASQPPSTEQLVALAAHITRQIRPLSLRNGYPRSVLRLGRLSLRGG